MSSGVGLFSRQGRSSSKRFLQPPLISSNFDIFSSQEREESLGEGVIHELSNVEERSNFDSEIEEPDQNDIASYLAKVQLLDERQATPPPPRTTRSQRLEDQEIIVVEEGAEVSQDMGGNESVILEHIEFVNDTHPENTPEWEEPRSREGRKEAEAGGEGTESGQEVKYVINLVPESPPWITDNMSNSTPYDIESSGFKLTPNRNSKNTCVDHTEPLLPDRPNKSCIEQPNRFEDEPSTPKLGKYYSVKGCDIKQILDKWNQELYPRLEGQYLDAPTNMPIIPPARRASADFHLDQDAKFCHSGFQEPSSPTHSHRLPSTAEAQAQTDIAGDELLHNQRYLTEEITQLRAKNIKLQEEARVIRGRESELQGKSQRLTAQQSEQQRRWGEQSRKLSSRNRELERMISQQNDTIRQFEQRQESLQKKLHKTISYQALQSTPDQRSPTFFAGQFHSLKMNKLHTFGMDEYNNPHDKCRREIEELQETIFDLKQQIAGIDIEVERRVRIISQALQQEIEEKAAGDVHSLKEELTRHKETLQRLEQVTRQSEQRNASRERDLAEREKEVSRMYDELVKEWKEMERQGEAERKRHKTQIKASNFYSPKALPKNRFDFDRSQNIPEKEEPATLSPSYYLSSKDLNPYSSTRSRCLPQRGLEVPNNNSVSYLPPDDSLSISFRRPVRTNDTDRISNSYTQSGQGQGQLCAINSKIQRLRQEINRELCAFNP